jgi:hypothetical protein
MKLVFYTTGDTRPASPAALRMTLSQLYERYAHAIGATEIVTADTDAIAKAKIDQRVAAGQRYDQIVFVGHGLTGGYFFSGRPDPRLNFSAFPENVFDSSDRALMASVGRALTDQLTTGDERSPSIEFHSCYTGAGTDGVLPAMQEFLHNQRTPGHLVRLLGYVHYFQWAPEVHRGSHAISGWQNAVVNHDVRPPRRISGGSHGTLTPPAEVTLVAGA